MGINMTLPNNEINFTKHQENLASVWEAFEFSKGSRHFQFSMLLLNMWFLVNYTL